ncbi:MAG: hypothetical protein UR91_C0032G0008 [Candidatus Nomurabacteria bacterium GW2011_GWC2_35_8]|uniref:Uncharacterized protein n=1 Tax=Candidatus Nomurabacteria bacterium GW2011_GWC2_35_8 TaxID=1618752 RepID=A0A0G0FKA6_9BACT|nr:MAG: hypothetical protein UR91_C0032G0008 [Candidatus Nomurabacteria bacterium GW2011_GWC2_35_8]
MLRAMCYVFRDKKAFTLIEMIIVIGVISIVLPIFFSIVFVILQQQVKIYALQRIKREGDGILTQMSSVIRNRAKAVYEDQGLSTIRCSDVTTNVTHTGYDGEDFYFKDKYGIAFNYLLREVGGITYMASGSANPDVTYENLNSSKATVSNFIISCYRRGNYSPPLVSINFEITDPTDSTISLSYRTKISLRSY